MIEEGNKAGAGERESRKRRASTLKRGLTPKDEPSCSGQGFPVGLTRPSKADVLGLSQGPPWWCFLFPHEVEPNGHADEVKNQCDYNVFVHLIAW